MDVDTKEIGKIIWKILGFSMNTTLRFVQNHPVFSGVSVFLLFLYIFLTSVFYFLIYSSPMLACLAVYVLNKFNSRQARPRNAEEKPSSSSESKNSGRDNNVSKSYLRHQRSVRRNARRKVEEWDSQAREEEKDKVILTSLYNDLLGRTPQFEDSPKAVETDIDKDEASPGSKSPHKLGNSGLSYRDLVVLGGEKPASGVCEAEEEVGDKEDRIGQKKNSVMEPGISEAERNRRLESLIARRRAKRLFKLAIDQKNMKSGGEKVSSVQSIPHISVSRDNGGFLGVNQCNSSDGVSGLQMPGSAPSVLLPARNPFDLPYDPQEEKPNLKGDSFDEEFSVITQKDMFFSRHESFCRPCLFSVESMQDANRPDSSSDVQRNITRTHLDTSNNVENQDEQEVPQEGEAATTENNVEKGKDGSVEIGRRGEAKVEEQVETDSNKEDDSGSSSSQESEQEFNCFNRAELRETIRQTMGKFPGPFGSYPRSSIPSPLPRGIPRIEDHNMFYATRCSNSHARTFSIASDLQVEVSEVSSPPTTIDGHDDSSSDGESYMYDTDIDREIAHCGEELQTRGSRQLESKPRIEARAKEENGSEVETSGIAEKPGIPVSQSLQVVEKSKEFGDTIHTSKSLSELAGDTIHTSKSLSSIAEEPEIEGGNQENVKPVVEELVGHRQYLNSPDSLPEKLVGDESDMQESEQKEKEVIYGSPEKINSEAFENANDGMEEDKKLNFSRHSDGEDPVKLSNNNGNKNGSNDIPADQGMKLVQESESKKAIDGQSVLKINRNLGDSATLTQPTQQLHEKEMEHDRVIYSRMLDNAAENIESQSVEQAERVAVEEPEVVENTNKDTEELAEHEDSASDAFPGHHRSESLDACRDVEEASEVLVSQVIEELQDPTFLTRPPLDTLAIEEKQEDSNQSFNELNEQEILKEGKDNTEPVQVHNKENVGESVVSEDIRNSNDSVVVTKGAEALTQEASSSPSPGSSSSPVDHTSSTGYEEVEKINDPNTDVVGTTRVQASYKQPPTELVTPDAIESMLKSTEFSAVQVHDKDFQVPERETEETSYGIVEPEKTTVHSEVHETRENKERIIYSSGGLSLKRSDMDNFVKDEDHSSKLTLADEVTAQHPKPGKAVTSDIVKDITGYSPELADAAAVNVSRELSEVDNDSEVHMKKEEENQKPVGQHGEAKENESVKAEEELGQKSDTLHNSADLVAREKGEEPIKKIETMDISETSKQADAEGTTETTRHGDIVSDLL